MKVIGKGRYVAAAALISLLFASPALAQDPDCSAASRQYGDNCDETDVIVFDPTPPENPEQPPPDDGDGGLVGGIGDETGDETGDDIEDEIVVVNPGDAGVISDGDTPVVPAPVTTASGATAVDETGAPATEVAAYPSASSDASDGGAAAVLPDTGGAGWIATVTGAAMISLALISRRLLRRS